MAIDDSAAVETANLATKGSPHKMIIVPIQERNISPHEHKKTQVNFNIL
jgi:hypothetical protein